MNIGDRLACYAQPRLQQTGLRPEGTRRDLPMLVTVEQHLELKRQAGYALVRLLDIPDLIRYNLGLAEMGAKSKAGGVQRLPLLLLGR